MAPICFKINYEAVFPPVTYNAGAAVPYYPANNATASQVRRVPFPSIPEWKAFTRKVEELFFISARDVAVVYQDIDGDDIIVSTTEEWREMTKSHEFKYIRETQDVVHLGLKDLKIVKEAAKLTISTNDAIYAPIPAATPWGANTMRYASPGVPLPSRRRGKVNRRARSISTDRTRSYRTTTPSYVSSHKSHSRSRSRSTDRSRSRIVRSISPHLYPQPTVVQVTACPRPPLRTPSIHRRRSRSRSSDYVYAAPAIPVQQNFFPLPGQSEVVSPQPTPVLISSSYDLPSRNASPSICSLGPSRATTPVHARQQTVNAEGAVTSPPDLTKGLLKLLEILGGNAPKGAEGPATTSGTDISDFLSNLTVNETRIKDLM